MSQRPEGTLNYKGMLKNYYTSLAKSRTLPGDLIWSSAVLMVIESLPASERERRFIEITCADEFKLSPLPADGRELQKQTLKKTIKHEVAA